MEARLRLGGVSDDAYALASAVSMVAPSSGRRSICVGDEESSGEEGREPAVVAIASDKGFTSSALNKPLRLFVSSSLRLPCCFFTFASTTALHLSLLLLGVCRCFFASAVAASWCLPLLLRICRCRFFDPRFKVMVLDIASLAVLFCTDCALGTKSTLISASSYAISQHVLQEISSKQPCSLADSIEVILTITKDSQIAIIDSKSGVIIGSRLLQPNKEAVAVSIHVIGSVTLPESITADLEKCSQNLPDETSQSENNELTEKKEQGYHLEDALYQYEVLKDPLLVICFTNAICFYSLKSAMEVDDMVSGLVLLYETGTIEIRCLPGLEIKTETSLMSILRWSFKTNMGKTMSFSDDGNIALLRQPPRREADLSHTAFVKGGGLGGSQNEKPNVSASDALRDAFKPVVRLGLSLSVKVLHVNGCEVACISCWHNKSRFSESLPCLHDKVLAAAAEAAINQFVDLKRKQTTSPGIISGLIRGLKGGKTENDIKSDRILNYSSTAHLEELFSKFSFSDEPTTSTNADVGELRIDDIEIDDPLPVPSPSITVNKNNSKDVKEREKLFQGSTKDIQPRMRSTQEIMTQYKFKGDAAAAAAHAREKLAERQEKLERISLRTAELQNDAENFSNLAHELAKTMENKKWWKL
ncbi:hypothetical protein ZIOFF_036870 [Zingiber officinale]|uniref:V-SNARE coiled-coil homology domain-containing protein n=1 Tax=Zingiber officinale TaxID=94328 RepID=A0A8J5L8W1_ZINOF|nr:hypothetical protein ZIOFF_036870 [Zingiber officinale]